MNTLACIWIFTLATVQFMAAGVELNKGRPGWSLYTFVVAVLTLLAGLVVSGVLT